MWGQGEEGAGEPERVCRGSEGSIREEGETV
jgi:hypothetical protein